MYLLAFLSGCAAAFDTPVRQTFVAEVVGNGDLSNAVALNSTSFNAAQMIGPAAAGLIIAKVGIGWAFLFNGLLFGAVLLSMAAFRVSELRTSARARRATSDFLEGFRYVWERPDLRLVLLMLFNRHLWLELPDFHLHHGRQRVPLGCAGIRPAFVLHGYRYAGRIINCSYPEQAASSVPGDRRWRFCPWMYAGGLGSRLLRLCSSPGVDRCGVDSLHKRNEQPHAALDKPAMRGRVMALRVVIALGGTPVGAPFVGWVANHFGPRWALGVGSLAGVLAALIAFLCSTPSKPHVSESGLLLK